MAGLGGGASDTAFGAHTANVLQKFTMYCVAVFFILVIVLGRTQKGNSDKSSVMDDFVAPQQTTEASTEPVVGASPQVPAQPEQSAQPEQPAPPTLPKAE